MENETRGPQPRIGGQAWAATRVAPAVLAAARSDAQALYVESSVSPDGPWDRVVRSLETEPSIGIGVDL